MFTPDHADSVARLQRLFVALTVLQKVQDREWLDKAAQSGMYVCNDH